MEEQTAAARRQEEAVEQERTAQQENVREAVEAVDAAQAATQKRLETTEAFRVQLERTKVADAVTKHAEEKATLAENNRAEKGQPYEADPLISTCSWTLSLHRHGFDSAGRPPASSRSRCVQACVAPC